MQLLSRELRKDAEALHRALSELMRVYQFRDRDRVCCHGLSVSQCYALRALSVGDAVTVNDLSSELLLEKSTVSRVVQGLEEKGYVERGPHPEDGRAVALRPTPAGLRLHALMEDEMILHGAQVLSEFDPSVRREIPLLIAALARSAAEGVERGGGCCRVLK